MPGPCSVFVQSRRDADRNGGRTRMPLLGAADFKSAASADFAIRAASGRPGTVRWRRDPESNRARRICNPLHNRFAIAPSRSTGRQGGSDRPNNRVPSGHQNKRKPKLPCVFPCVFPCVYLYIRSPPRRRVAGAGEESRTLDLNLGKVALYQLSYSRIELCGLRRVKPTTIAL